MDKRDRVVITVIGSKSDGPQTIEGLKIVVAVQEAGTIKDLELGGRKIPGLQKVGIGHYIISCHRNPKTLIGLLELISGIAEGNPETDFVFVMGAGWTAALPGFAAAYLRFVLEATNVFVVGVAFEYIPKEGEAVSAIAPGCSVVLNEVRDALQIFSALNEKQRRDLAAILSLTELPGDQLIYQDDQGVYFGAPGWWRACQFAVHGEIPEHLRHQPKKVKLPEFFSYEAALKTFEKMVGAAV